MELRPNYRLFLLGVIVVAVGVFVWLGGGTESLGIHPINLLKLVPGYILVGVGALIVLVAFVLGLGQSRSS
jgi:hypothetical protein